MKEKFDRYFQPKKKNSTYLTKMVIKKYGRICEYCGLKRGVEGWWKGWEPTVHHKDGNQGNNDIQNLMPVCGSCHRKIHIIYPNWRYLNDGEILKVIEKGYEILGLPIENINLGYIIRDCVRLKKEVNQLRKMLKTSDERQKIINDLNEKAKHEELTIQEKGKGLKAIGW